MHQSERPHHHLGRPRWRTLLGLITLALALHGLLLGGSEIGARAPATRGTAATAVEVRTLVPVAAPMPEPEPAVPAPPPAAPVVAPPAPAPRAAAVVVAAAPSAVVLAVPEPAPAASPQEAPELVVVADARAKAEPSPPIPTPGELEVPTYRTRLPPAATLHYDLRRGMLSGTGELQWKPAGERYELRLAGHVAGMSILVQTSQGLIDEAGVAPLRFVDQRRRNTRAANFQRDKGIISFSGPATEYPLLPGSQDRLSWMVQLGAILNAEPQRAAPDAKVAMFVVGARGDGDVWVFRCTAAEPVATALGPVNAVKFTREPRRLYDTLVEVWLDPARAHLPVRARLTTAPDGNALELLLRDMQ